ncbi:hypothetical protein II810_00540 [bacterium]|nr:hypothetical protein [bacterium]
MNNINHKPIIEQHFHGAFGIDFNNASIEDILFLASEIYKYGVGGIFPTLATDSVKNIKNAISNIKEASKNQSPNQARILGIHLEGIFLNPDKKGIHPKKYLMKPTLENYKLIDDSFIKIVTLAPELADSRLIYYLISKDIKVQAGHCTGSNLAGCSGVTHIFNAMSGIHHRIPSTALSALSNDDIYCEVIADGMHISDDILKLVFRTKPLNRIILISDCLPCAYTSLKEFKFAGKKIFYDGKRAVSKDGTIAGSTMLLVDIIKRLVNLGFNGNEINQLIDNVYEYHNISLDDLG